MKKRKKLIVVLIFIFVLGTLGSIVLSLMWFNHSNDDVVFVGVSGRSNSNSAVPISALRGANLYFEQLNKSRVFPGYKLKAIPIETLAENGNRNHDGKVGENKLLAMIGGAKSSAIPMVTIYPYSKAQDNNDIKTLDMMLSHAEQSRFVANYTRNVIGKKLITIIHEDTVYGVSAAQEFTKVYKRFGTNIHLTRVLSRGNIEKSIFDTVNELEERKDLGTIFLASDAASSAQFIFKARNAGITNDIVGLDALASRMFTEALRMFIHNYFLTGANTNDAHNGKKRHSITSGIEDYTHNLLVATPVLFDTAGEDAQTFRDQYIKKYNSKPDWLAAYSYESARLISNALLEKKYETERKERDFRGQENFDIDNDINWGVKSESEGGDNSSTRFLLQSRAEIERFFADLRQGNTTLDGVLGVNRFNLNGEAQRSVQIGQYNGDQIIAASTQLEPLKPGVEVDYLTEIKSGKMLYVNNRFMYKTNVIYTGVELLDVVEIDWKQGAVLLDFYIWFRYRGDFKPEDIVFLNAVDPVELKDPIVDTDKNYRLYRVEAKFYLDFLGIKRPYGSHVLGLSFHHKKLNRNNAMYVVDELGFGFDTNLGLKGQLKKVYSLEQIHDQKIDRAWIAQDIVTASSLGNPLYTGHGTVDAEFSRVDYGLIIHEDRFKIYNLIPLQYLYFISVFGFVGSLAARWVDKHWRGRFWSTSSWFLRLIFWPLLLLAIGNIAIDLAIKYSMPIDTIDNLVFSYDVSWWIIMSTLLVIFVERFCWQTLESKSQRKIPNIIRLFSSFVIYLLAFFGVIAFILEQPLTSFLATGGLFAMIVGLAIQSNISNVFSGIVINLAKPFVISDYLNVRDLGVVYVMDITWRTVRVKDINNNLISIPNGMLSDSIIVNLSREYSRVNFSLRVLMDYPAESVGEIIDEALLGVDGLSDIQPPHHSFIGSMLYRDSWLAEYEVIFFIRNFDPKHTLRERVLAEIQRCFYKSNVPFSINT